MEYMKVPFLSIIIMLSLPSQSSAEQWVALGDMHSEMDVSSVSRRDDFVYLRIRHKVRKEQGLLTVDFNLAVSCPGNFYYILSGQTSSDWSPSIVPMPDLPEDQRTFYLPTENPAFNNMYDFVCQ